MIAAIACVVAGGPWFADGLRALRLRRSLSGLREQALGPACRGLVQVRGTVAIESPLFSPLSARPCAGYVLEAGAPGAPLESLVRDLRAFRIAGPEGSAHVDAALGDWRLSVTSERVLQSGESPSTHVAALLEASPEMRWLRERGQPIRLVERALDAGAEACVVGHARRTGTVLTARTLALRTGTDDAVVESVEAEEAASLEIGGPEAGDLLVVSDTPAEASSFSPPAWRLAGTLLGPALALAGLLYLAHAVDAARAAGIPS